MKNAADFIRILVILLAASTAAIAIQSCSSKQTLQSQKSGNLLGILPFDERSESVFLAPDLKFRVDLGSSSSFISRKAIDWLIANGYSVDSTICVAFGRDSERRPFVAFRRYHVDIPIWKWQVLDTTVTDSTVAGGQRLSPVGTKAVNMLHGVDFLAAADGEDSSLGIDFFGNLAVEYRYYQNALALYRNVPDDYQLLADLSTDCSFTDRFDGIPDFYITLNVDGMKHEYRILTQTGNVALKLPKDQEPISSEPLSTIEVIDRKGVRTAAGWNPDEWIEIGDRAGSFAACYFDAGGWDERCFNPFLFFNQNVVLSFGDSQLYIYPHTDAPRRTPLAWLDYTSANER